MASTQYLLLVRHGETEGNLKHIAHGRTESPLTPRGIRQAETTARAIQGRNRTYDVVYTSPLERARNTGRPISELLDLPIDVHENLAEGSLGDWEGVTYRELDELGFAKKSIHDDDFSGHKGESPNQLGDRMQRAVSELRTRHADENLIIVSHGAAIAHLVARLLGTRPAFGHQYLMLNTALTELAFSPDRETPELTLLNSHDHLPEDLKNEGPGTRRESKKLTPDRR